MLDLIEYPYDSQEPGDYYRFITAYEQRLRERDKDCENLKPISRAKRAIKLLYAGVIIEEVQHGFYLPEVRLIIAAQANKYCYVKKDGSRSKWYRFKYLAHLVKTRRKECGYA